MLTFWTIVGAIFASLAILSVALLILMKPLVRLTMNALSPVIGDSVSRAFNKTGEAYGKNPLGLLPVLEKLTPLGLVELRMRAETGTPPSRPLGSPLHFSPWPDLLLNFANVQPMPTSDDQKVSLGVTIGPEAAKPLKLASPVLMAAMSFGGALSLRARIALAKASDQIGTATNSGEGVYIAEESKAAQHYVIQYHRGTWPTSPQNQWDVLEKADAIEIQLSQGAQGAAPMTDSAQSIHPEMRRRFGLAADENAVIAGRLQGVNNPHELIALVRKLKDRFPVPVGIKFAASNQLEQELPIYVESGVDFLTIDGAEGGTHGGPPVLQDAMGLPTLWGIARTRRYLDDQGVGHRISILAAGGLTEPGHFLKAMALGATACYSGSALIVAMLANQMDKAMIKAAPPYALLLQGTAYLNDEFDETASVTNLVNLYQAWHKEFDLALRALGKTAVSQLTRADLVALTPELSRSLDIPYVGGPHAEPEALVDQLFSPEQHEKHAPH